MPFSMTRIIFYVHDVRLLTSFYQTHFGFTMIEEIPDEWVVLKAGGIELALHLVGVPWRSQPIGASSSASGSNTKMVFCVKSGLPDIRQSLLNAGVVMGELKRYDGFAQLMCDGKDPEGNMFQLSQSD